MTKEINQKIDNERAQSSIKDYQFFGTELTRMDNTMNDMYGDGSDHKSCHRCGFCLTCGDCSEFGCGQKTE